MIKTKLSLSPLLGLMLLSTAQASATFAAEPQLLSSLATHPYWLKLGHYLPDHRSGYRSTVDSPEFFLSATGKVQPLAELTASYQAFFSESRDQAQLMTQRCRFPARYRWLAEQLQVPIELDCPEIAQWQAALDPHAITLVFPTAYVNSPSSMFGHTLLRVDAKDQSRHQDLVAFAINFAAEPDPNDGAFAYALNGMIGRYPAGFTLMPYYKKVREYNDIESRDIWEYPLNFSAEEVERILLHLWELQQASFDYYFIDENCSYHLMALLQLAREDLDLVSAFKYQALPVDIVKALMAQDIAQSPQYRASFGTRLMHFAAQTPAHLFEIATQLKQAEQLPHLEQLTLAEQAQVLELAYEWLNFELYDQALPREQTAKRLTQLLRLRSQLKTASPFTPIQAPSASPELGHGSARWGIGAKKDSGLFTWKASYHDLLDDQQGYISGAQINFFDLQASWQKAQGLAIDQFYVVDVMALAPTTPVVDNLAWQMRVGFDRLPTQTDLEASRYLVQGGLGRAWGDAATAHYYLLALGNASYGNATQQRFELGVGVEAGAIFQIAPKHRFGLEGQGFYQLAFEKHSAADLLKYGQQIDHVFEVSANWQWHLAQNWSLSTSVSYQHTNVEQTTLQTLLHYYY